MTQITPTKVCKRCRAEVTGEYTSCPYDGWQLEEIPPDPLVGKIFNGKYEIDSILGKGGMSVVYKARDVFMERTVAIKILHTHLVSDNTSIQRFQQEAQAAGSLNHPNIITVYDFGLTPEDQAFLIMECFEGPTLAEVLDDQGRIPAERAIRIMKQICDGLEHAHRKGIVHRDLKPSNLCLVKREDGIETVKIVDFGIAKLLPQEGKQRQQLTQTGQIFGSPLFMSPEQCQGKALDLRSDLYSLGCLMYEALTGVPPFMGPTAFDTMTMHISEAPKSLKKAAPDVDVPPELERPIMRCLEKNPDKRYQTASEIKADLPPLPEELPSGAVTWTPSWYGSIRHNPAAQMIIIIFFLLVIPSVLFFVFWPGSKTDRGTLLDRTIWNWKMSEAEHAVKNKDYDKAAVLLDDAEALARAKFSDPAKLQDTLQLQAYLGSQPDLPRGKRWTSYAKEANKDISALLDKRVEQMFETEYAAIKELDTRAKQAKTDSTSDSKTERAAAEAQMAANVNIAEGRIGRVKLVARELSARGKYLEEEELLRFALAVDEKVLGPDHTRIAELKMLLAECLLQMQNTPPVDALLKSAYAIYHSQCGVEDRATVEAALKLGQFQRDQNRNDEAGQILKEGLDQARALYDPKTNQNADLLIEALRGYADYLQQIGKKAEGDKFFAEADRLYAQAQAAFRQTEHFAASAVVP